MKKECRQLVLMLLLCLLCLGAACQTAGTHALPPLKLRLFKVGKADAMVLRADGRTVVLDTGEDEDGEEILSFLRREGAEAIDLMLITHFDRDHVGGADLLIAALPVRRLILPDYEGRIPDYFEMLEAAKKQGLKPERLREALEFELGVLQFRIDPPSSYEVEDPAKDQDNELSLFVRVTHGQNHLLFTGDAEERRIEDWLSSGDAQHCQFLKFPHHGIFNRRCAALLEAVRPQYAVICDSEKHPAEASVLELLRERSIASWETKNGDVTVLSNGEVLEITQKR